MPGWRAPAWARSTEPRRSRAGRTSRDVRPASVATMAPGMRGGAWLTALVVALALAAARGDVRRAGVRHARRALPQPLWVVGGETAHSWPAARARTPASGSVRSRGRTRRRSCGLQASLTFSAPEGATIGDFRFNREVYYYTRSRRRAPSRRSSSTSWHHAVRGRPRVPRCRAGRHPQRQAVALVRLSGGRRARRPGVDRAPRLPWCCATTTGARRRSGSPSAAPGASRPARCATTAASSRGFGVPRSRCRTRPRRTVFDAQITAQGARFSARDNVGIVRAQVVDVSDRAAARHRGLRRRRHRRGRALRLHPPAPMP